MRIGLSTICITLLGLLSSSLFSQVGVNITSCIDNTIYENSNDLSNGSGDYIIVGRTGAAYGNSLRRGLIMTDFDIIPSSAIIVSAKLVIIGATGSPQQVSLHRALKPWSEGLSNATGNEFGGAPATPNDATWDQPQYGTSFWTAPGGDYDPIASSSTLVKSNMSNVFSGPQFVADIQAWVDGVKPNYGWMMIGDEVNSGSAIGLNSGDIDNGIPYINVKYTLPARQVLINEVHPSEQWIELYNPGPQIVDIEDWYICNNSNCDQVSSSEITFLQGSSTIPSKGYARIAWDDISLVNGEVAIMKSSTTLFSKVMEDYVQYGAANQTRSNIAVIEGLWGDMDDFIPSPSATSTIGLGGKSFANGEATNLYSWETQSPTPSQQNVCFNYLNLTSPIGLGVYDAEQIDYNGTSQSGSGIALHFGNFVEFKPNSEISQGTFFQIVKRDCSN